MTVDYQREAKWCQYDEGVYIAMCEGGSAYGHLGCTCEQKPTRHKKTKTPTRRVVRAALSGRILALLLVAISAPAQEIPKAEIIATVEHMGRLNKELQAKLDEEKAAHNDAQNSVDYFQSEVVEVTNQANAHAARADKALDELDAANVKLQAEAKHVSKLKTICCSAGAGIALLLLIMVGLPKAGIYGIAGTALIAGGVFAGLWKVL